MSLPSKLLYQTKVEPAAAKSARSNIQPQNGTDGYGPNSVITINLPTRNNLCFVPSESYLKFNATILNTGAAATYYRYDSNGAHGFIRRIRVFHGSNLLEDIDNYEVLAKMMFDMQSPSDATYGKYSILAGTCNDLAAKVPNAAFTASGLGTGGVTGTIFDAAMNTLVNGLNNGSVKVSQANRGALALVNNATGVAVGLGLGTALAPTSSVTNTYCLNLLSIIGTLCNEKYFPLFACTSAPIRVEIQLVPSLFNAVATDAVSGSFTINSCEYIMNTVELSDSAMGIIQNSLQGAPLQFAVTDYKNFVWSSNAVAGGSVLAMPIPAKYSSLKSLLVAQRDNTNGLGTRTYFPVSSCKFNLSTYYFRIGASIYPPKAPTTTPEYFSELLKATGSMSDVNNQPAIDIDSYSLDTIVACNDFPANNCFDTANSGSFYIGLDLENYPTADRSHIFAGYNSNTDDIFLYMQYQYAVATGIRYDAFAMFDSVLVFENNTAYCKF